MNPILRFAAIGTGVTAGLLGVGFLLTRNSAAGTREAMVWACVVVFVGSLVGALPLVSGLSATAGLPGTVGPASGPAAVSRFLAAMLLRMGAVGVGAVAVVLLGEVRVEPFLLWLAVSYLAFLIVDTAFALRVFRS